MKTRTVILLLMILGLAKLELTVGESDFVAITKSSGKVKAASATSGSYADQIRAGLPGFTGTTCVFNLKGNLHHTGGQTSSCTASQSDGPQFVKTVLPGHA